MKVHRILLILFALVRSAQAQLTVSGNLVGQGAPAGGANAWPIAITNTSDAVVKPGDAVNNAIRVNIVAGGGSGGTSMTDDAAFTPASTAITPAGAMFDNVTPDSVDEGDAGVLRMSANRNLFINIRDAAGNERGANVDASNRLTTFADVNSLPNEGQQSMANSIAVAIASDQSAVPASQSGTWTVQPGNTANTTPWFVKTVPLHGCSGNTLQDITQADVATGAGSDLTTADTCVFKLLVTNVTTSVATITLRDRQATPIEYVEALSVPANSTLAYDLGGMKLVSGVKAIAGTASALNVRLIGVQ